jgi:cytochrome c-type biogenesis protein CcmH
MSSLWLPLALLSLTAMLFVLLPLWRQRGQAATSLLQQRRDKNREVFTQRRQELQHDLEQGLISAEELEKLLAELQRAFLLDMDALDRQGLTRGNWTGGKPVLLALALLIPLISVGLYNSRGAGPDLALPALMERLRGAESEEQQTAVLGELADTLQQRLERRPDDMQSAYMLGTLNLELDRFEPAIATFRHMLERIEAGPDRATVLGQLAQSQYMLADSTITDEVRSTIDQTLAVNPNEFAVMSILAIDAFLREDFPTALQYWQRQLASSTPGSPQAEALRQRIAMLEAYVPQDAGDDSSPAAPTGPTISVTIRLAPELAAQVTEDMRLFVFVRNPDMPMPILAQNLAVPEFPFTITLDNSMSMTGMTVETFPRLVVGARLSRSGNATAQPGDLQTLSESFTLSELTAPLDLVIDEVAP